MTDAKAALRITMTERRAAARAANPEAGTALTKQWPKAIQITKETIVSGYARFRDEIDPLPLMRMLAAQGVKLALPVTPAKDAEMNWHGLSYRIWHEGDPMERGAFGVMEPLRSGPIVTPDVILVPLLAFDRSGGRLGYGQGHFDNTFIAMRQLHPIVAVGLAFSAQEVPEVPLEPHDAHLDWVITEREAIRCR